MKVLIGITQDLDSAQNDLLTRYKGLGTSTDAGPFKTREEAEHWKNFMVNRRDNYEEIQTESSASTGAMWFGFTVESLVVH